MKYLFIGIYLLAVAALCYLIPKFLEYSWPDKCWKSLKVKMICAAMFIVTAVCCILYSGNFGMYARLMFIGLLCGVMGDLLIHVPEHGIINVFGGVAFFVGHIFYIIAFYRKLTELSPDEKFFNLVSIIGPIAFVLCYFVFAILSKISYGKLTVPVILYALMISSMLFMALRLALCVNSPYVYITVLLGAALFVSSDSTLSVFMFSDRFKTRGLKAFYIITYFAAQVLLGTSITFVE